MHTKAKDTTILRNAAGAKTVSEKQRRARIGAGVSRSENQLELALSDVSFRSASPDALARHRQASLNFGRIVYDAQAPYTSRSYRSKRLENISCPRTAIHVPIGVFTIDICIKALENTYIISKRLCHSLSQRLLSSQTHVWPKGCLSPAMGLLMSTHDDMPDCVPRLIRFEVKN
ncbi:hypothetical protein OUZ56_006485 [Daphnia magna]|uniref:Uncharacterized protein n=1 Tax=Daphnia magna TaxID=35525 RepID=A0ABQ9YVT3_9CRUS|nr:hypothetical protein OUZ56_006485 [Daphnia magna]